MTYLQLVNAVLRRLREDEVTTVNESNYSTLIGDFVNDAKRLVEDSWDWTALRATQTITTVVGTATYSLTDFGVRGRVNSVHNETDNTVVRLESLARIREQNLGTNNANGTIISYAIDGVDGSGDIKLRLYQTPNAVKTLTVYGVKRPADLSEDADELLIPFSPVVNWAYSYALRERGETGGDTAAEQAIFAQNDVATAIALDSQYHPEELIWDYV